MNHDSPPIGSTQDIFDQLDSVIGDIHGFLSNFCERLQRLTAEPVATQGDSHAGDTSPEAREEWEAKRARTEQKIRDHVELLSDAWLRLEAEQRNLLQTKEGLAVDLPSRADKNSVAAVGGVGAARQSVSSISNPPQLRQSAVREFERLRQEIQLSRPLNNVK
jgi:hypothetical protein